ncbi:hypothetical protein [Teichococcus vastitatis]|uniref:Uncharacterized protein n=1 Tax=Teichococcus vastitatis TaxID=2307076 RepID=A0ABS9W6L9_9PROT|nr:hypothetical protein [Pseudoroseomonas vastitatis]MCI0754932.1 hypothetical protein [Pseudoroseomonas vastitatis]
MLPIDIQRRQEAIPALRRPGGHVRIREGNVAMWITGLRAKLPLMDPISLALHHDEAPSE